MDLLENYSRPQMMDDYYVIKEMIEMETEDSYNPEIDNEEQKMDETNNNNNNNDNEQEQNVHEIRAYFISMLGQCKSFSNCRCFLRNRRPRSSDDITIERREAFYIRTEDVQRYENAGFSRFEVREVILQSSLDIIHNYIFHAKDEEMNVNESHSNKFVTQVTVDDESKSDTDFKTVKKMGQYSFGCQANYWSKNNPLFVSAKYSDLKTELISNSLHSISLMAYEALEESARDILKTNYGKNMISVRTHDWMDINGEQLIPKGTVITERHLIAVLSYTNHGEMQYDFKKHGFRKLNEDETDDDVRQRNAEIAHWGRAIFEVVHCWGSVMSKKKPLFHGISCKLYFSQFSQLFFMPTSLTTNLRIAQNFATEEGIILVLKHAREGDGRSLMFDVSHMSDFPNEEERLIFNSKAQFYDILMDETSLKQWMKVLRIYERIRMGQFLAHISISAIQQETIVHMIHNYLEEKKSEKQKEVEFYENGNVPNYIQQCFNECTGDYTFCLNSHGIKHAISNEQLLQYLDGSENGKNSEFLSIFEDVYESYVYEWLVTGDDYDSYFLESCPIVVHQQKYSINLAKEPDDEPSYLEFHWELKNYNGCLFCLLRCDHFPTEISIVKLNLGIFVKETKSEKLTGDYIDHQKQYGNVLHGIVDSKKLYNASNSENNKREFSIKLLVSVV